MIALIMLFLSSLSTLLQFLLIFALAMVVSILVLDIATIGVATQDEKKVVAGIPSQVPAKGSAYSQMTLDQGSSPSRIHLYALRGKGHETVQRDSQ